jgi:hypothetical protein
MKRSITLIKICSLFAVVSVLFSGCKSTNDKILNEGVIEFDVTAVDPNHPWAGMIPSTATLKFKDDKFLMEMSTMGMFTTTFICDQTSKTLTQMVKFLDIKQACIEKENDIKKENSGYQVKWEETPETKIIAGYKCKKIKANLGGDPTTKFEVYYTKDMGAENMNDLSPYTGIKGMLMQYRLKRMGLELQFTAKSVKKAEITDNIFEIPAYFKIVSKAEIEKIFQQF